MERRTFTRNVALGALGVGAAGLTGSPARAAQRGPRPAESEKKQWAREHLRGLGGLVMPSFSPDFKALDEEGIRQDVRHRISQGFCSILVSATGASADERRRTEDIVREESEGRILRSAIVGGGSAKAAIASLDHAARLGCSHALIMFPDSLHPETEEDVYAYYREIIDSTSLGILLYGRGVASLRRFHPSGIPFRAFDRLADHPNVVGMKLTHGMAAGLAYELSEHLSDRLLMGPVHLDLVPVLGKHYPHVQWSSQWISDAVQSPGRPYGVELFDLVRQGRMADAMTVYWQMQPLIDLVYEIQGTLLKKTGAHPWQHMKYYQWVMGGNGGLLPLDGRESGPVLDNAARQLIRDTCASVGIAVDRPDEEFLVGRAAYARGVRASDLTSRPHYA